MNAADGARDGREPHLGEYAELFALGALEPHEFAEVEAHLAVCARCAQAVGDATTVVAALDEAYTSPADPPDRLGARIAASARAIDRRLREPRRPARHWPVAAQSVAAACLLAVGLGGGVLLERHRESGAAVRDSAVLATIARSHFSHVAFAPRTAGAPAGKVLYARDQSWYYVIVDSAACGCRVISSSAAGERDMGAPLVRGSTSTLFIHDEPQPTAVELRTPAGTVLGRAMLVRSATQSRP